MIIKTIAGNCLILIEPNLIPGHNGNYFKMMFEDHKFWLHYSDIYNKKDLYNNLYRLFNYGINNLPLSNLQYKNLRKFIKELTRILFSCIFPYLQINRI